MGLTQVEEDTPVMEVGEEGTDPSDSLDNSSHQEMHEVTVESNKASEKPPW